MVRIDAHCHFWELSRGDYTWLDAGDLCLTPIARDFQPHDIAPLLNAAKMQKMVVVQAAATESETDYLLALANRHENVAGVVGWTDLEAGDVQSRLAEWSAKPKFKGIRPMLQDIDDTQWLLERPQTHIFSTMVDLGLCFDALVEPRHLPVIHQFCTANPALRVVIDHAAKPKAALAGDEGAFGDWSTEMKSLARDTNVFCKLSGLLTELDARKSPDPQTVLQRYVDVLLETFGPDRLMWGSDWPVVTLASDYLRWHNLAEILLDQIGQSERNKVFGGTASDFYGLGVTN